ncbi:hypothetical protein GCM10020001_043230 [Nonomuraea salmonea]
MTGSITGSPRALDMPYPTVPTALTPAIAAVARPRKSRLLMSPPAGGEPVGAEPAGTEPVGREPVGREPAGTEPAAEDPVRASAAAGSPVKVAVPPPASLAKTGSGAATG